MLAAAGPLLLEFVRDGDNEVIYNDDTGLEVFWRAPDMEGHPNSIALGELLAAQVSAGGTDELLPDWYMPPPMGSGRLLYGWRRRIVLLIVASFVLINAYGLCSTYGRVGFG